MQRRAAFSVSGADIRSGANQQPGPVFMAFDRGIVKRSPAASLEGKY